MHFTRSSHVRGAVDVHSLRGEAAALALEELEFKEPYGVGLEDFDSRNWAQYLDCTTADEAAQNMLDMVLDDESLRRGKYDLGPRALATAAMRIVSSLDPMQRLTPGRRYLSKPQAQALAAAVLTKLGVPKLTGVAAHDSKPPSAAILTANRRRGVRVTSMWARPSSTIATRGPGSIPLSSKARHHRTITKWRAPAESATFELIPSLLAVHRPLSLPTRLALASVSTGARLGASLLGFREARVSTEWGRWHFFLTGPSPTLPQTQPPIAIVHGMFTTSSSMLLLACALAAALPDRLIVVPDLLGFDFSFSRPERTRALPAWHEQVEALATALLALKRAGYESSRETMQVRPSEVPGAEAAAATAAAAATTATSSASAAPDSQAAQDRAINLAASSTGTTYDLIGHSFGGWVSEEIAASYPALTNRLVLLCPGGHSRYRRFRSEVLVTGGPKPMAKTLGKHLPVPLAALATTVMTDIARSSGVVRQLLSMGSSEFFRRPDPPIKNEVLLLWGTHDDLHSAFWGVNRAGQPPNLPHGRQGSGPTGLKDLFGIRRDAPAVQVRVAMAGAGAGHEVLDSPVHMLRDLTNSTGFWLERCNHAIQMDATHTCAWLASRFLQGGRSALPDPPAGSAARMVADDSLIAPDAAAPAAVRMLCEAMRLSTSSVFRVMMTRKERLAAEEAAKRVRASKL